MATTEPGTSEDTAEQAAGVEVTAAPVVVPPKKNKTFRDMWISMGLLAAVVLLFVGLNGGLTFAPGGAKDTAPPPTADAVGKFATANRLLPFTPAVPQGIPDDWHANSAAVTNPETTAPDTPLTVRGGWLVNGSFIALVATDAEPADLLSSEFAGTPGAGEVTGTVDAGGAEWTVTSGVREEAAWYRTTDDGLTYLITGSADEAAFRTLAGSIAGA